MTYVVSGHSGVKELQKTNQTEFRIKKVIKRKIDKLYVKWKVLYENIFSYKMSYFPESYTHSQTKIKLELYLSNYATKFDLKIAAAVDASKFAKKTDLARFKSEIGKLETTPVDSNDQKDVEKNEAIKKTVYDELVKKVNAVRTADTSNLVKKTHYNTKF